MIQLQSQTQMNTEEARARKKRVYSKGGCRECKRRKIKCLEEKPQCFQCQRLSKPCSYPEAGERVPRVSRKVLHEQPLQMEMMNFNVPMPQRPFTIQHYTPKSGNASDGKYPTSLPPINGVQSDTSETLTNLSVPSQIDQRAAQYGHMLSIGVLLNDYKDPRFKYNQQYSPRLHDSMLLMQQDTQIYNRDDLNVLAADLNNLVNNIVIDLSLENLLPNLYDYPLQMATPPSAPPEKKDEMIARHVSLDEIPTANEREQLYLKEFYNEFAGMIMPLVPFDSATNTYVNPARDILLKVALTEPFLRAAILSQGARIVFQKRNLLLDEEAYVSYLSMCLKLIEPAIRKDPGKIISLRLTSNVENVLLTVLLLTTANACNVRQDWRPHLRGAKDILLRDALLGHHNSKILVFCKYWFMIFEILAGISTKCGGTLKSDDELDSLINTGSEYELKVLKEFGLVTETGFNVLGGYHHSAIPAIRDLIKLLNRLRSDDVDFGGEDAMHSVEVLSQFHKLSQISFIDNKGVLLPSEFKNGETPRGVLLDSILTNGEKVIISWMDCLHQAYIRALMLTVMTKFLQTPVSSLAVQKLVEQLKLYISYLTKLPELPRFEFKCALMMFQWPILTAAINNTIETDRDIFLRFFTFSLEIGSASASLALSRIQKFWLLDKDEEFEKLDVVAY